MPKLTQQIVVPDGKLQFADLLEIEKSQERNTDQPRSLPMGQLHTAPDVFQIRKNRLDEPLFDRSHIRVLMSALNEVEMPLEAIQVTAIGQKFYIIDGHHRYSAYRSVGWSRGIPVKIFNGSVSEAQLEAGRENHKDKLPVSKENKLEFAWVLVRRESFSIAEIQASSGVSPRTISNMRAQKKKLVERGDNPWEYSWKGAQRDATIDQEFDRDKWIEEKSDELAQRMCTDRSVKLVAWPEVLSSAIQKVSGELPRKLVEQWADITLDVASYLEEERYEAELLDI
ncbi:ParB N-terminal domain-containing protein [Methylobacterium sp. C25]|uniref:ParB/RepB/Spo0J family partition protein n=1 Tax=Methylobacterium sp. C25 TaxID=2721622 RepID=UPI001F22B684|nr:ParB N-terminal domain-containing protein [Methylobacterium sp. C25]MCE4225917.1 ParB N-terminal domain-containing protein [Methylobacterium sp. C25]